VGNAQSTAIREYFQEPTTFNHFHPLPTATMPAKSTEIEAKVAAASAAMDADPRLNAAKAARQFGAPYHRLLRRRKGVPPSHTRGGHNKKLSPIQDEALRDYIFMLYSCGTPANYDTVRLAANRLLYYDSSNPESAVSARWTKDWIKRQQPFLKTLKTKPIAAKRLDAHIVEDIEEHFKAFKRCKAHWKIQDEDIYNFDETGFQIGVTSGENVLVPVDTIVAYATDPDNRELITSVETVNPAGKRVPPMVIFSGAYHLRRSFKNKIAGDTLFARSATGYSNDKLGLKYLQHFNQYSELQTKEGNYRMLIFDGHGSHLSQEFLDFCWQHRIRPFLLPPHTTHLLQPLDVGVFQAMKYNFKREVRREVFLGAREISKVDFFAFFQQFHDKTFKNPHIHTSAYKKTGLIPLNPLIVLQKMKEYQAIQKAQRPKTPPLYQSSPPPLIPSSSPSGFNTPPPQQTNWAEFHTPLSMRTRKRGINYIEERQLKSIQEGIPLTPSVLRVTQKVNKASETSILKGTLSTHRLFDLSNAEAARKRRKEESGKVVQKYGEIYAYQARKQIEEDKEEEKQVVNMREKRVQKKLEVVEAKSLRQYKKVLKEIDKSFKLR
jgi:hypothetical protein